MVEIKSFVELPQTIHSGNVYSGDCPSRGILDHVTSRWSTLILVMLLEGTHRFSELAKRIGGVSERMLAHSLQALEADGFVVRVVHPTKPPKVEYSLTKLGEELAAHIHSLTSWVEAHVSHVQSARLEKLCTRSHIHTIAD